MAVEHEKLIGFICVYGNKIRQYGSIIDYLHVMSSNKGKGVGTSLILKASAWLQENYPNIGLYLEALADNKKAIGYYESIGAKKGDEAVWLAPCGSKVK